MSDLKEPGSEVKPQSLTEAVALPTGGKQLTLWGDVWRKLKRDKRFYVAAFLVTIFVLMAIAPFLFFTKDPNACPITDSAPTLAPSRTNAWSPTTAPPPTLAPWHSTA